MKRPLWQKIHLLDTYKGRKIDDEKDEFREWPIDDEIMKMGLGNM